MDSRRKGSVGKNCQLIIFTETLKRDSEVNISCALY